MSEALRASNVADGLGLRQRWRAGHDTDVWDDTTIPFGKAGLPVFGGPEWQAIDAELRALDDAVDALADVLVAESVHQVVQGNAQRAGRDGRRALARRRAGAGASRSCARRARARR